jgi:hypothetical protein
MSSLRLTIHIAGLGAVLSALLFANPAEACDPGSPPGGAWNCTSSSSSGSCSDGSSGWSTTTVFCCVNDSCTDVWGGQCDDSTCPVDGGGGEGPGNHEPWNQ